MCSVTVVDGGRYMVFEKTGMECLVLPSGTFAVVLTICGNVPLGVFRKIGECVLMRNSWIGSKEGV